MKQKLFYNMLAGLLLFMGSTLAAFADDFDPVNPAEPYVFSKVTVNANPKEAVSSLGGAGHYREGTTVTLRSSRKSTLWTFSHWEKDGEWFSSEASPKYTMGADAVTFTACYDYTPLSPDEPWIDDNRLYLVAEPLTACSFNKASGESYKYDTWVSLKATPNTAYTFLGWYANGVKVSDNLSFNYQMPDNDVEMVARFIYDPANPEEPGSDGSQTNVQTNPTGDCNKDGRVNVTDAVFLLNVCLKNTNEYDAGMCDVNGDGVVNVSDVVAVINRCLSGM